MAKMTDAEVMAALKADTPLNRARQVFSGEVGAADQRGRQYRSISPIEMRRQEFESVRKIADALGVTL